MLNPAAFSAMFTTLSSPAIAPTFSTTVAGRPTTVTVERRGGLFPVGRARRRDRDLAVAGAHQRQRTGGGVDRAHRGGTSTRTLSAVCAPLGAVTVGAAEPNATEAAL